MDKREGVSGKVGEKEIGRENKWRGVGGGEEEDERRERRGGGFFFINSHQARRYCYKDLSGYQE